MFFLHSTCVGILVSLVGIKFPRKRLLFSIIRIIKRQEFRSKVFDDTRIVIETFETNGGYFSINLNYLRIVSNLGNSII